MSAEGQASKIFSGFKVEVVLPPTDQLHPQANSQRVNAYTAEGIYYAMSCGALAAEAVADVVAVAHADLVVLLTDTHYGPINRARWSAPARGLLRDDAAHRQRRRTLGRGRGVTRAPRTQRHHCGPPCGRDLRRFRERRLDEHRRRPMDPDFRRTSRCPGTRRFRISRMPSF